MAARHCRSVTLLLRVAVLGLLPLRVAAQTRQEVSVSFLNSEPVDGGVAWMLNWRRRTGELKEWGAVEPGAPLRVKSFAGDTWVVTHPRNSKAVMHQVTLDIATGAEQTVDVSTGRVTGGGGGGGAPPGQRALGVDDPGYKAWDVEVDLGAGYGFEFSPARLAAELRVTLRAADGPPGSGLAPFGLELDVAGAVTAFAPPGLLPDQVGRSCAG
jgi:hypothetical protein